MAKQHFGDGPAALHAGIEGFDDRGNLGQTGRQNQRFGIDENQYHWLTKRHDPLGEFDLAVLQLQRRGALGFTDERNIVADNQDDHIGNACAILVDQSPIGRQEFPQAIRDGGDALARMYRPIRTDHLPHSQAPIAQLSQGIVGVGTNQGNGTLGAWIKRQQGSAGHRVVA